MTSQLCTFEDRGLTLSYEIHGSGNRNLLYLHGLFLDAHLNHRLAQDLAKEGNRVILLDLPGQGLSDKPRSASSHRMDSYALNALSLLDKLGIEKAVIGGMSLGADVALQLALLAPDRLQAMIIEMPVLENATPVAALLLAPILGVTHYGAGAMRGLAKLASHVNRDRLGAFDQYFAPLLLDPDEMSAILHGLLIGPMAPSPQDRSKITQPTLVIGHRADLLHSFRDATDLVAQLPNARLLQARTMFELRATPKRLTTQIANFLDEVWSFPSSKAVSSL